MNKDQRAFVIYELAQQGNTKPTEQDIVDFFKAYTLVDKKKEHNKLAKKNYEEELTVGYLHTDGITYVCTRDGIIDMYLAVTLLNEAPDEPVYILDISGNVVEMTLKEFKDLAIACGNYHYDLRQWYWGSLR